mmetsp:Transcript_373/g.1210  ORF Transcript_373/g.1210 Transcript_373/m.1210 type:complete len:93 (-) Transcript_373:734-1012(-)
MPRNEGPMFGHDGNLPALRESPHPLDKLWQHPLLGWSPIAGMQTFWIDINYGAHASSIYSRSYGNACTKIRAQRSPSSCAISPPPVETRAQP